MMEMKKLSNIIFLCMTVIQFTIAIPDFNTVDEIVRTSFDCRRHLSLTVSIVKDGRSVFQNGYGYLDKTNSSAIKNTTMFGLASLSKAFASTLIAKLVANSTEITFDTPVKDILKNDGLFADDLRSKHATLRDLLSHRLAIPGHGHLRMNENLTRENLVPRLKYFKASGRFRDTFIYNNLMFGLLTYIAEVLGGKSFEDLITEHIFVPLGMTTSSFATTVDSSGLEFAQGYMDFYRQQRQTPRELSRRWGLLCGSGCMYSSAEDMSKWMLFHLNGGISPTGQRVLDKDVLAETHAPQMRRTFSAAKYYTKPQAPVTFSTTNYAMAWMNGYYRGHKTLFHSGGTWGYRSFLIMFPDANLGIFVSLTGDDTNYMYRIPLVSHLADLYLGETPWLNSSTICTFPEPFYEKPMPKSRPTIDKTIPLSKNASSYVGVYDNPAYGAIQIKENAGKLIMTYGIGAAVLYPKTTVDEFYMEFFGIMEDIYLYRDLKFLQSTHDGDIIDRMKVTAFESSDPPIFIKQGASPNHSETIKFSAALIVLITYLSVLFQF